MSKIIENLETIAKSAYCKKPKELNKEQLHQVLGKAVMGDIAERWELSDGTPSERALTGTWAYLLTNDNTPADEYTLIQMDEMMTNMTNNVTRASLFQLKNDGLISSLDDDMLNDEIDPLFLQRKMKIKDEHGNTVLKSPAELGYSKLGHFTVEHLLAFVGTIITI